MEPQDYANVETNLFPKVRARFAIDGTLEPIDLMAILVWKANRAKNMHIKRVGGPEAFCQNAPKLGAALFNAKGNSERLKVALGEPWRFRLPTATALLTVLFPDDFTIYDVRVCEFIPGFDGLANRRYSEELYVRYTQFKEAVRSAAPCAQTLREADQYLWGLSWIRNTEDTLRTT